ncbi:hypothetical protein OA005_00170 [Paracoccaceae bacterium]|nr:hypothetical protein [Paracoccaceae bacterium]
MHFIIYDFETSGKDPHWDQILQVGAALVNKDFEVLETLDLRSRLKPGLIPSPQALLVNNTDFTKLLKAGVSSYEMLLKLEKKFISWSPATFIGYNSLNFDEEFLRNSFFRALLDPYITSSLNNARGDLLELLRTVEFFFPETIKVPLNEKERKVFKLDQIAPANSIDHLAHDALGDVIATKELAKLIIRRKPGLWKSFLVGTQKPKVVRFLTEEKLFFLTQTFFGKTSALSGTFLFNHPIYNFPVVFDLNYDPGDFINLDQKELKDVFCSGKKFVKFVKLNKSPILLTKKLLKNSWFLTSIDMEEYENRISIIKNSENFKQNIVSMLSDVAQLREEEKEMIGSQEDIMAEETLYSGGFPSYKDRELKRRFKEENWSNRYGICKQFSDKRLSYFGLRLIYEEFPSVLPSNVMEKIDSSVTSQLTNVNSGKWKTCDDFDKELDIIEYGLKYDVDKEFLFELKKMKKHFYKLYEINNQ